MRIVTRPTTGFSLNSEEIDICTSCEQLFAEWLKEGKAMMAFDCMCIDCEGSGRYPNGATCKSCAGSGYVSRADALATPSSPAVMQNVRPRASRTKAPKDTE